MSLVQGAEERHEGAAPFRTIDGMEAGTMRIGSTDLSERVLVVAEIGNNHEGDPRLAGELIDLAAEAGAGAVKFQTFVTDRYVRRDERERFERLRSFELPADAWSSLRDRAHGHGLAFLSTPFDLESADRLEPIVDAFKISSGDNTFMPLIERVARTAAPILISTGLATEREIGRAVRTVGDIRRGRTENVRPVLLHCVSAYPVPIEHANLGAIATLRQEYDCPVGYSDHTLGVEVAALAVAAGARVIEKHFTIAHDHSSFRDHELSATPEELAHLVECIRGIEQSLGDGRRAPRPCEVEAVPALRRAAVARRDLAAGTTVAAADVDWLRAGGGVLASDAESVLGATLRQDVARGTAITAACLAAPELPVT